MKNEIYLFIIDLINTKLLYSHYACFRWNKSDGTQLKRFAYSVEELASFNWILFWKIISCRCSFERDELTFVSDWLNGVNYRALNLQLLATVDWFWPEFINWLQMHTRYISQIKHSVTQNDEWNILKYFVSCRYKCRLKF